MADGNREQYVSRRLLTRVLVSAIGLIGAASPSLAQEDGIPVGVLSGPHTSYREAVSGLTPVLQAAGCRCLLTELPKSARSDAGTEVLADLARTQPRLIVAVGVPATLLALKAIPNVPVIFCMVPNALDQPFLTDNHSDRTRLAGVTTDASPQDQVNWILALAPAVQKIGVLYSPRTQQTLAAIKAAAHRRGVTIVAIETTRDSFTEGINALNANACGGVLMLPDAGVYDSINVRALLLWGIHQKKPVWTFSENIVRAGAFFGLYTEPARIGRIAGELAVQVLQGAKPAALDLRYVDPAPSAVNENTAELIGVGLEEDLLKKMTKRYGKDQ